MTIFDPLPVPFSHILRYLHVQLLLQVQHWVQSAPCHCCTVCMCSVKLVGAYEYYLKYFHAFVFSIFLLLYCEQTTSFNHTIVRSAPHNTVKTSHQQLTLVLRWVCLEIRHLWHLIPTCFIASCCWLAYDFSVTNGFPTPKVVNWHMPPPVYTHFWTHTSVRDEISKKHTYM